MASQEIAQMTPVSFLLSLLYFTQPQTHSSQRLTSETVFSIGDHLALMKRSCGPISAFYCIRRLGKDVQYQDVTYDIQIEDNGVRLTDVQTILGRSGVSSTIICDDERQLGNLPLPCIIILRGSHCVVLDEYDAIADRCQIFEPATRKVYKMPAEDIRLAWSGEAVVFAEPKVSRTKFIGTVAAVALGVGAGGWLIARRPRRQTTTSITVEPCAPEGVP